MLAYPIMKHILYQFIPILVRLGWAPKHYNLDMFCPPGSRAGSLAPRWQCGGVESFKK